jgi:hypothetical protein
MLLRLRVAVGRHQGVRSTSHPEGTFLWPTWKEGQAAPRRRPRPFSRILTAWKVNSRKSRFRIVHRSLSERHEDGF